MFESFAHSLVLQVHIVVEAVLNRRSVTQAASVHFLHGLTHNVGTGVPIDLKTESFHFNLGK